ncbi:hypothetical protein ACI6QG_19055 [Roseococcus sp. DSY-14]|uniref:hypothetical protein n=1 Tax=Roseococcus sp. DSY-14 TaxID=3369650 RepID=UPI00387B6870
MRVTLRQLTRLAPAAALALSSTVLLAACAQEPARPAPVATTVSPAPAPMMAPAPAPVPRARG